MPAFNQPELVNFCRQLIKFKEYHVDLREKIDASHDESLWPDFINLEPLLIMLIKQLLSIFKKMGLPSNYSFDESRYFLYSLYS